MNNSTSQACLHLNTIPVYVFRIFVFDIGAKINLQWWRIHRMTWIRNANRQCQINEHNNIKHEKLEKEKKNKLCHISFYKKWSVESFVGWWGPWWRPWWRWWKWWMELWRVWAQFVRVICVFSFCWYEIYGVLCFFSID